MNLPLAAVPAAAAPAVDLDAYCARIGYHGARTPTLATLRALHALHPDAIVFEAIDVLLGRGIDLDPAAIDAKLIHAGRGGYCFEHNSLFMRVLEALGFEVQGLSARVLWNRPADAPAPASTHMALRVLVDGEAWLADVGFGSCVLTAPLQLGTRLHQGTPHDIFRLLPLPGGAQRLEMHAGGERWLPVYELLPEVMNAADYEMRNWFTSTHPRSLFRNDLIVARTTPQARHTLLNARYTVRAPGGSVEQRTLDGEDIARVLVEVFGLPVEPQWQAVIERAVARSRAAEQENRA